MTGSAVRCSKLFTTSCIVWTSKSWTMIRKATAAELLVSGYVFSFFMGLSLDALLSYTYMPGESLCFVEKMSLFKISELQLRAMFGTCPAHLLAHDCDVVQRYIYIFFSVCPSRGIHSAGIVGPSPSEAQK